LATLKDKTVQVFSMQGKPVQTSLLLTNKSQINVATLVPGMYMLRIGDEQSGTYFKLVKL
jgi:hypothetical protein